MCFLSILLIEIESRVAFKEIVFASMQFYSVFWSNLLSSSAKSRT